MENDVISAQKSATKTKSKKKTTRKSRSQPTEQEQSVPASNHAYELTQFRRPAGMGVHVVSRDTGRYFMFSPTRNPSAPRFWSVRIDGCTKTGDVDPDMPSLLAVAQLSHEEMVEIFQIIRTDVSDWLAADDQKQVRDWLSENDLPPDPLPDDESEASISERSKEK